LYLHPYLHLRHNQRQPLRQLNPTVQHWLLALNLPWKYRRLTLLPQRNQQKRLQKLKKLYRKLKFLRSQKLLQPQEQKPQPGQKRLPKKKLLQRRLHLNPLKAYLPEEVEAGQRLHLRLWRL